MAPALSPQGSSQGRHSSYKQGQNPHKGVFSQNYSRPARPHQVIAGGQDLRLRVPGHVRQGVLQPVRSAAVFSDRGWPRAVPHGAAHALATPGAHQTQSTSETSMSNPISVKVWISSIFSRPCAGSTKLSALSRSGTVCGMGAQRRRAAQMAQIAGQGGGTIL